MFVGRISTSSPLIGVPIWRLNLSQDCEVLPEVHQKVLAKLSKPRLERPKLFKRSNPDLILDMQTNPSYNTEKLKKFKIAL